MPPALPKRYYSVKEAAKLLSVSTNTIYTYLETGKIKARRIGKGRFKIPHKELSVLVDFDLIFDSSSKSVPVQPETPEVEVLGTNVAPVVLEKSEKLPMVVEHSPVSSDEKTTETNILLPTKFDSQESNHIVLGQNDKIIWRLFKGLSFFGLGIIYLTSGNLVFSFSGGFLSELSQILNLLLPFGLILAGSLILVRVFFEDKLIYFDALIHIIVAFILGYYSFISIASGEYGRFVLAASFTILTASHIVSGINRVGSFFENFTKFGVLASLVGGIILLLYPDYFPLSFATDQIKLHQGVFGFLWFGFSTIPLLYLLSVYGKASKVFAAAFYFLGGLILILFATELAIYEIWDTSYLCYLTGIFGLFLSWWISSHIKISFSRFYLLGGSFVWVSMAILIGLYAVNKNGQHLRDAEKEIAVASIEEGIQNVKSKIDAGRALLVAHSGNSNTLETLSSLNVEQNIENAKQIYDRFELSEQVLIINGDGIAQGVYPRETLAQGANFSSQDYFKSTKSLYKGIVSPVFVNIYGKPTMAITEPIFNGNEFAGIIVMTIDLNKISQLVQSEIPNDVRLHALDPNSVYAFGANIDDIGKIKEKLDYLALELESNYSLRSDSYQTQITNPDWRFEIRFSEPDVLVKSSYINILLSIFVVVNAAFSVLAGVVMAAGSHHIHERNKLETPPNSQIALA